MAIKIIVRAAVTVSGAVALSVDTPAWKMIDLPRAVLKVKDNEASDCGKEFAGYYTFPGLKWANSWKSFSAWNTTDCVRSCDENENCIAFTAKAPPPPGHHHHHHRHHRSDDKMVCNLYKALMKAHLEADHRAMSYMRCVKGFDCEDGFQFTHEGTWRGGTQMENLEMESKAECRLACFDNRGCVGFTYRISKEGNSFCTHFADEDNKDGPSRDMRANTYSKCAKFEAPPSVDVQPQTAGSMDEESKDPAPSSKDEQSEDPAPSSKGEQSEAPAGADEDSA